MPTTSIQPIKPRFTLAAMLLLLLALYGPPAAAQGATTLPRPATDSLLQAAREDTTYALQRLFHESRRRYTIQALTRGAGLGYLAYRTWETFRASDNTEKKAVNVLVVSAFGYLFTRSAINLYRYRSSREKRLLAALEQGKPLPVKVRKKFKASYFDTITTSN